MGPFALLLLILLQIKTKFLYINLFGYSVSRPFSNLDWACFVSIEITFRHCNQRLCRHSAITPPSGHEAPLRREHNSCHDTRRPQEGETLVQWQALRCWRHRSAVQHRERSRKQGPRNQLQWVTNKERQRARITKPVLVKETPESPWQIGGKLVKTHFTRYAVIYVKTCTHCGIKQRTSAKYRC